MKSQFCTYICFAEYIITRSIPINRISVAVTDHLNPTTATARGKTASASSTTSTMTASNGTISSAVTASQSSARGRLKSGNVGSRTNFEVQVWKRGFQDKL